MSPESSTEHFLGDDTILQEGIEKSPFISGERVKVNNEVWIFDKVVVGEDGDIYGRVYQPKAPEGSVADLSPRQKRIFSKQREERNIPLDQIFSVN